MESYELAQRIRNMNSDDLKSVKAIQSLLAPAQAGGDELQSFKDEMSPCDRTICIIRDLIPDLITELNFPTTHSQRFRALLHARNWEDFQSIKALKQLLEKKPLAQLQHDATSSGSSRLLKRDYELEAGAEIHPKQLKIGEEEPAKIGEEGPEEHEPHVEENVEGGVYAEAAAPPPLEKPQEPGELNAEGGGAADPELQIEDAAAGPVVQHQEPEEDNGEEEVVHAEGAELFLPLDPVLDEPEHEENEEENVEEAGGEELQAEEAVGQVVQPQEEEENVEVAAAQVPHVHAGDAGAWPQFPPVPPDAYSLPLDEQATDLRIKLTEDGEDVYIPPKPQGPRTKRHS